MKSAFELAMERLEKEAPSAGPLSSQKKAELAEIDRVYEAKIAEKEVFLRGALAKERDPAERQKIEKQLKDERQRLNDMRGPLRNLPQQSYQRRFLWRMSFALIGLGTVVGLAFHLLAPGPNAPAPAGASGAGLPFDLAETKPVWGPQLTLEQVLHSDAFAFHEKLSWLANHRRQTELSAPDLEAIRQSTIDPAKRHLLLAFAASLHDPSDEPSPELAKLTATRQPIADAQYALGLFYLDRRLFFRAGAAFEAEGKRPDASYARAAAVDAYREVPTYTSLSRLSDDPAYDDLLRERRPGIKFRAAIATEDWAQIVRWLLPAQYSQATMAGWIIGSIAGLAWLAFLVHLGGYWHRRSCQVICVLGVALGGMSTWATILAVIWQEEFLGFTEKPGLLAGLIYCIGGIGLREELIKLLFFAPMLPILLRFKDPMLALVVGGCVGLGFAIEENIGYYQASPGTVGPTRFLTANFLHLSATALCSYALYQAVRDHTRNLEYLFSTFAMVVLIHGLYDAFLIVPELAEYRIFAFTAYVFLCFQLFQLIDHIGHRPTRRISLSFVFTLALSLVLATSIGHAVAEAGLVPGIQSVGSAIIGVGAVVIMFFRVIGEPVR